MDKSYPLYIKVGDKWVPVPAVPGPDGGYYIPSDAGGSIHFTGSKSGMPEVPDIPIPGGGSGSPQPLTFTGAVSAEYDGTAPVSVGIPENYPVVEETASTLELTPNIYHKWGEMAALAITLGAETPGVVNEFCGEFKSGAAPTTFSVPASVKWAAEPNIEAGRTYQFSIIDNVGVIGGA